MVLFLRCIETTDIIEGRKEGKKEGREGGREAKGSWRKKGEQRGKGGKK